MGLALLPLHGEDDLLHLSLVEEVVRLDCVGKGHDLVKHEARGRVSSSSLVLEAGQTYFSFPWYLSGISSDSAKTLRTGHRPIWKRRFLLGWCQLDCYFQEGLFRLTRILQSRTTGSVLRVSTHGNKFPGEHQHNYLRVVDADAADDTKWAHQVKGGSESGRETGDLDDHVGPAAFCDLHDARLHAGRVFLEVERFGAELPGNIEATVDAVDDKQVFRLEVEGGKGRAAADRAGADDDHGGLAHVGPLRHGQGALDTIEARGENVRHEDEGLFRDAAGRLHDGPVRVRDPHVFSLASIEVRAAEQCTLHASCRVTLAAVPTLAAVCNLCERLFCSEQCSAVQRTMTR